MSVSRRIWIGAVLVLVTGGLAAACAGAVGAMTGAEVPKGVDGALSYAGDFLGWARVLIVAGLGFRVLLVREDD